MTLPWQRGGPIGVLLGGMDDRARLPLLDVRIASPCAASWVEMEGDDRARFCRRCEKNVYDLSSMTAAEARRFVAEREGACVRLFRRRDGTVMTSDCPVGARRRRLTKLAAAALTLGSAATALAMAPGDDTPRRTAPSGSTMTSRW